jgi:aspartate/tyrosine/aromatic aminotransferase
MKTYLADAAQNKVNVEAGTYRDENGMPWAFPAVRIAKEVVANCLEHLLIEELKAAHENVVELVFHGWNPSVKAGRVTSFFS